jgi:hypothetical protein
VDHFRGLTGPMTMASGKCVRHRSRTFPGITGQAATPAGKNPMRRPGVARTIPAGRAVPGRAQGYSRGVSERESARQRPEPVQELAARMRAWRLEAGNPSFRELERITGQLGERYPRSTIEDKIRGVSFPSPRFVRDFVTACARYAGRKPTESEYATWNGWYEAMTSALQDRDSPATEERDDSGRPMGGVTIHDCQGVVVQPRESVTLVFRYGSQLDATTEQDVRDDQAQTAASSAEDPDTAGRRSPRSQASDFDVEGAATEREAST